MSDTWYMYLGVDIGATKTLLAIASDPLNLIEQKKFSTPSSFKDFAQKLRTSVTEMINADNLIAAGIAVPGQVRGSELLQAGRLPWQGINLDELLSWLRIEVHAQNDASLGGLAEARYGAGQDARQLLYITISTGIGSGIVIDKQIPDYIPGSEGGHAILDIEHNASFEQLASGSAFHERYGRLGKDVSDPKIWNEYGKLLGTGVYNMMTLTEPDVIVIGGSMGKFFKHYQTALNEQIGQLNRFSIPNAAIREAKFPDTAVVRGSIAYAMESRDA